jgi:site-specific DNA-methyltransferase (adenine-specific)
MKPYYEQDGITIYHGDCRDVLPTLAPVDLVLTDPPYGIGSVKADGKMGGSVAAPNRIYLPVHDDDRDFDPTPLMRIGRRQIIWGADHFVTGVPSTGRLLVWDKRDGTNSNDHADAEIAWDSAGGPCRLLHHRQMGMIHDGYGPIGRVHPNQKPERVIRWCLSLAPDAQTVLDPFMGSGTTLRAAKDLGRRAIGIEIEERYCEIAAKRLRQSVLPLEMVS